MLSPNGQTKMGDAEMLVKVQERPEGSEKPLPKRMYQAAEGVCANSLKTGRERKMKGYYQSGWRSGAEGEGEGEGRLDEPTICAGNESRKSTGLGLRFYEPLTLPVRAGPSIATSTSTSTLLPTSASASASAFTDSEELYQRFSQLDEEGIFFRTPLISISTGFAHSLDVSITTLPKTSSHPSRNTSMSISTPTSSSVPNTSTSTSTFTSTATSSRPTKKLRTGALFSTGGGGEIATSLRGRYPASATSASGLEKRKKRKSDGVGDVVSRNPFRIRTGSKT